MWLILSYFYYQSKAACNSLKIANNSKVSSVGRLCFIWLLNSFFLIQYVAHVVLLLILIFFLFRVIWQCRKSWDSKVLVFWLIFLFELYWKRFFLFFRVDSVRSRLNSAKISAWTIKIPIIGGFPSSYTVFSLLFEWAVAVYWPTKVQSMQRRLQGQNVIIKLELISVI